MNQTPRYELLQILGLPGYRLRAPLHVRVNFDAGLIDLTRDRDDAGNYKFLPAYCATVVGLPEPLLYGGHGRGSNTGEAIEAARKTVCQQIQDLPNFNGSKVDRLQQEASLIRAFIAEHLEPIPTHKEIPVTQTDTQFLPLQILGVPGYRMRPGFVVRVVFVPGGYPVRNRYEATADCLPFMFSHRYHGSGETPGEALLAARNAVAELVTALPNIEAGCGLCPPSVAPAIRAFVAEWLEPVSAHPAGPT